MHPPKPDFVSPAEKADRGDDRRRYRFPLSVTLAAIIWIAYGTVVLVGLGMRLMVASFASGADFFCASIFPFAIALVFIQVGWSTLRGRARGTAANGYGSIIWGMLHLAWLASFVIEPSDANPHIADYARFLIPASLLVAGILALVGRGKYHDWKNTKGYANR